MMIALGGTVMRNATVVGVMFVVLAACAEQPHPGDEVTDAPTAIRIAKAACANDSFVWKAQVQRPDWQATLRNRVWEVWLEGPVRGCHDLDVKVSAADGKPGQCMECVIVTSGGHGVR